MYRLCAQREYDRSHDPPVRIEGIQGLINIEGNLAPEDCMFSRRVVSHSFEELSETLFQKIQSELRTSNYPGNHMIAHNMALNTDIRAYFAYSFETVRESDSGQLLDEFIGLPVPRMFLYGDANRALSYLSKTGRKRRASLRGPSERAFSLL